jgi:DNA-binding MarR family transcriptional regulator/GNAT superfamily N-acetyltransferase
MQANKAATFEQRIGAVRRFNRFYTRSLGVLQEHYLETAYSLTELRVLYELGNRDKLSATDIKQALGIDHGYLSRILRSFGERGLIARTPAADDRRQKLLTLTAKGRKLFAAIDKRQQAAVAATLDRLGDGEQARLVAAMQAIETLIAPSSSAPSSYVLRPHRSGDMGWVVARHGVLYGTEYGWNSGIEALTAEIVAAFLKNYNPARDCCWIAEIDGEPVGSVFLVRETDEVARLRLLLVEPRARGLGIGRRLVEECIRFARLAGYKKITLWTHGVLAAARAIYKISGFQLTEQWVHDDFGKPEPSETWELQL